MLSFTLIAATIVIVVLILLVVPLFKNNNVDTDARREQNILFARQRLNELDQQYQLKTLSQEDYEALKIEIENNLSLDLPTQNQGPEMSVLGNDRSNKALVLGLCCALPIMAGSIYWLTGTPTALTANQQQTANQQPSPENIMEMVRTIDLRLKENPDDLAGWKAIAPIYRGLNLQRKASQAYSKIIELGGADAVIYAEYADTLALAAAGAVTPEAEINAQKSLNLDPDNQLALWLAGLGAMQNNKTEVAVAHWQHLVSLMGAFPQQQEELRGIIAQARQNDIADSINVPQSEDDNSAPQVNTDNPDNNSISVLVSLDPSLATIVSAEDTVFVVALARSGPPAPLAVKRLQVKDLPTELSLSDADAMLPQLKLSLFEQIEVSARISKNGHAIPQAGDLSSDKVSRDKQGNTFGGPLIELKINQQIGG